MEMPTTPGTSTVAKADSAAGPSRPRCPGRSSGRRRGRRSTAGTAGPGADDELDEVLAQHDQVAQDQRPEARSGWPPRPSGSGSARFDAAVRAARLVGSRWPSVAQLLAGEVDEDGLEGRLGDREVGDLEAGRPRPPLTTRGSRRSAPFTWSSTRRRSRVRVTRRRSARASAAASARGRPWP
jgi:hypothetical protein